MAQQTGIRFGTVAFDTPDPRGLATFYAGLLGWDVDPSSDEEWVTIRGGDGGPAIAFQLAPDHVPPTWPAGEVPQQVHLDLYVADYDSTEPKALALGATPVQDDTEHPGFRVYTDPSGHPFCLCLENA
ncbi:VOC family protein [Kineococcus sp. SYSU DK003]|uniref:VOC family protein n=1 Tax=Kineococcus sp. SYSU DK003 TaxID=3383124 RepID=UPI003D7E2752